MKRKRRNWKKFSSDCAYQDHVVCLRCGGCVACGHEANDDVECLKKNCPRWNRRKRRSQIVQTKDI